MTPLELKSLYTCDLLSYIDKYFKNPVAYRFENNLMWFPISTIMALSEDGNLESDEADFEIDEAVFDAMFPAQG